MSTTSTHDTGQQPTVLEPLAVLTVRQWRRLGSEVRSLAGSRTRRDSYTYVILRTSKHAQSDVVEGLAAGADDYITKPFDPQELKVRLHTGKRILCLLDQLTTARETLRELAAHHPLTALRNHKAITELLVNELNRAERQGSSVGVVLIDLDHFKSINHTHGHLVGDQVLRDAAKCMNAVVRPYDAVGRLGGEEFLVVLPGCDEINAVSHAERLRSALNEIVVNTLSLPIQFTASLGVTVVRPEMRVEAATAIRNADSAMYAAKHAGPDRVVFRAGCLELV